MNTITPTLTVTIFMSLTLLIMKLLIKKTQNLTHTKHIMMLMFIISLIPLSLLLNNENETMLSSPPIIYMTTTNISISLILDTFSLTFIPVSLFITWSIVEFSIWYMSTDPYINKFIKHLLTFLIAMLIIITANNMIQLFVGWEGVGIMSFLLIGWWYARSDANSAALQAIIYNRIGDIGLIMTTAWLMSSSSMNMQELFTQHETMSIIPLMGLVGAAAGKSAQFGLHPWLPAAMEGPTPVSALLHSSTMVVAGVFLLIRLHPIMQNNITSTTCLILGATTTLFAAASAITQHDIKKIIALSTTSQLGLMMTMIGLNQPKLAFLHMAMHSFFKALLFLCSGSFIHNLGGEQDIRKMGNLNKNLPMTSSMITIASLSLMGMPFLSGFYSKDTIIETMTISHINSWALMLTLVATMLSAMYSMRIINFTLTNFPRTKQKIHQENKTLAKPTLRLTLGSILAGTMTKLSTLQTTSTMTMPTTIKLSALTITIAGILLSTDLMFLSPHQPPKKPKTLTLFFNQLAFFNMIHRAAPMKTLKFGQQISTELVDLWALENYGPKGLSNSTIKMIHTTTQQKNLIKNYLTTFTLTIILTLVLMMSK
uniref:NADH-ubiquinone oxidoreductase chain 5 n=1 Tax=Cylindrophis ruffus TaxID=186578 RepID=Q402K6_CYLRU|nr:NADH dehydrogenase subunit 5 [Cylindrophis ruffus]BAE20037.1 NADH dehydrogenase subunit 5 [Cylindrophis ruffus]